MSVSTAPAAKAWLYGQLQSGLSDDGTHTFQMAYATQITTENSPDDMVWLGAVANRVVSRFAFVGDMGDNALQEEYDLTVEISVFRVGEDVPGGDLMTDPGALAEARAWDLAATIESLSRDDPTMGGAVTTSRPNLSQCDVDWDESGNGRVASLTLTIHCYSPI